MPLLNKKNYIIFSPHLIQQAMRHRDLDFDLVGLAFARQAADLSDQALGERVKKGPSTYTAETLLAGIKSGLTGHKVKCMTAAMLAHVGSQLNPIDAGQGRHIPSLWVWMRDMMTMATVEAFYGHASPFRADPAGLDALWDFDEALDSLLFLPPAMARAVPATAIASSAHCGRISMSGWT